MNVVGDQNSFYSVTTDTLWDASQGDSSGISAAWFGSFWIILVSYIFSSIFWLIVGSALTVQQWDGVTAQQHDSTTA